MTNGLPPEQRAILAAYRKARRLTPGHRRELWTGVQTRLVGQRRTRLRYGAVAILSLAACLVAVLGLREQRAHLDGHPPEHNTAQDQAPAPPSTPALPASMHSPAPLKATGFEAPPALKATPHQATALNSPPLNPPGRTEQIRAHTDTSTPAKPTQGGNLADIDAETRLLQTARASMARGDLGQARTALNRHATEHRNGALTEERDALMAIVACTAHEPNADASSFTRRYPSSPLSPRVQRACAIRESIRK